MNAILDFLTENWEMLSLLIYEIVVRVWPTKWNLSILDQTMKLIGTILKNRRIPHGDENVERKADGTLVNAVKVDLTKHIIKSLLVVMLVGVFAYSSQAQQWENYKGIRLVNNRDTTQQLAVQGSLFFDDVLDSLYLYDGARWLNLSRAASNGGGGGLMTASNGLSVLGSDVRLGGPLDAPTTINMNNQQIGFVGTSNWFTVRQSSADFGGTAYSTIRANNNGLTILGTLGTLKYSVDKSSDYDDRTVPDWGNVKSLIAIPDQRIPFGIGTPSTGLTSSANLTYNSSISMITTRSGTDATNELNIYPAAADMGMVIAARKGLQLSGLGSVVNVSGGVSASSNGGNVNISSGEAANGFTNGSILISTPQPNPNKNPGKITFSSDSYHIDRMPKISVGYGNIITRADNNNGIVESLRFALDSTYTPTVISSTGVSSIDFKNIIYSRIGSIIRCDFVFTASLASGLSFFTIEPPNGSGQVFNSDYDVVGVMNLNLSPNIGTSITANAVNSRITFSFSDVSSSANITATGYFMYRINEP